MRTFVERLGLVLALVVAAGFGVVIAVIGAFWQPAVAVVGSVLVPIGLAGALLVTWAGARVTASLTEGRSGAVAFAIGWLLGVVRLTMDTPAGDLVVPGTWYGYLFLGGGLAIVVGVALLAAPLVPTPSGRVAAGR